MASDDVPHYQSGDLTISPELGVVRSSRGESVRLGPINMKVLTLLLGRSGQVVSRNEIFAAVWTNQAISDDVLTRAISDIRSRLTRLSGRGDHIETVPKRGYRWTADVRAGGTSEPEVSSSRPGAAASGESPSAAVTDPENQAGEHRPARAGPAFGARSLAALLGTGLIYVAAFIGIASAAVWLIDELAPPAPTVIAMLPTQADAAVGDLAAQLDQRLADFLIGVDRVDLLSRSAVDSRPGNPFPYFYSEFGARWLVESEVRRVAGETMLSVALVDARAGIVLFQAAGTIDEDGSPDDPNVVKVFRAIELFIVSRQSP